MKSVLEIDSNSSPLSDQGFSVGDELSRILYKVANQLHGSEHGFLDDFPFQLKDSEGNEVGQATVFP